MASQCLPQQHEGVADDVRGVAVEVEPLPHRADIHMLLTVVALVAAYGMAGVDEVPGHPVAAAAGVGAPAGNGGAQPGGDRVAQIGIAAGVTVTGVDGR